MSLSSQQQWTGEKAGGESSNTMTPVLRPAEGVDFSSSHSGLAALVEIDFGRE